MLRDLQSMLKMVVHSALTASDGILDCRPSRSKSRRQWSKPRIQHVHKSVQTIVIADPTMVMTDQ